MTPDGHGVAKLAVALIHHGDRVLALDRGGWYFPHVPAGDEALATLADEIGISFRSSWLLETVASGDEALELDCFVCERGSGEVRVLDGQGMRWVSREELADLSWEAPYDRVAARLGMFWDSIFASEHW